MKKEKIDKEEVYRQFGWKYENGDYYHEHSNHRESKFSKFRKLLKKIFSAFKNDAQQRLFSVLAFTSVLENL